MTKSVELLGLFAAVCTTSSSLPQLIKIIKTHSVKDLSLITCLLGTIGCAAWGIYGALLKSLPLVLANILSVSGNAAILWFKIIWDKPRRTHHDPLTHVR